MKTTAIVSCLVLSTIFSPQRAICEEPSDNENAAFRKEIRELTRAVTELSRRVEALEIEVARLRTQPVDSGSAVRYQQPSILDAGYGWTQFDSSGDPTLVRRLTETPLVLIGPLDTTADLEPIDDVHYSSPPVGGAIVFPWEDMSRYAPPDAVEE